METLIIKRSTWNLFSNNTYRYRGRGGVLTRLEIRFPKHVSFTLLLLPSISLQRKQPRLFLLQPILASSLSSSDDPLTHLQDDETQIEDQSKTVRVKFQLEKECSFGEQFHIVGNDPILGLWDPSSAIPLDWSDGHTWTVELDIPIGKPIHFKFILKQKSGNILWQPGPDRILQTWETENTICVSGDWDNAEFQKVMEEELVFIQNESISNSELAETPMAIVAENITYPEGKTNEKTENEMLGTRTAITSINEENAAVSERDFGNNVKAVSVENLLSTKAYESIVSNEGDPVLVPGITPLLTTDTEEASPEEDKVNTIADASLGRGKAVSVKNLLSTKGYESIVSDEGAPVLVPGLTPLLTTDTEEASPEEDKESTIADASLGHGKTKECDVPEIDLKEKPENDSPHLKEATEMIHNDEKAVNVPLLAQDLSNSKPFENDVLENDMQWGRKTLQKLLANLGFL